MLSKVAFCAFPLLVIASPLLLANGARAQSSPPDEGGSRFWLSGGLGPAFLSGTDSRHAGGDIAVSLNATYQFGRDLLSARAAGAGDPFKDSAWDLGLVYGRTFARGQQLFGQPLFFSLGAGLAYVEVWPAGRNSAKVTAGLPLEVQVYVRPLRFLGVGIYGFANVNPQQNFLGAALGIQIGNLR